MKALLLFMLIFVSSLAVGQEVFRESGVHLSFDKMHYDMGKVIRGDIKKTSYSFTNQGQDVVEIAIVDGCSCTTLDWTRGPIQPGESGVVDVTFDSTEKEKSETVDIDMTLTNRDPKTGNPIFIILDYSFELVPGE